MTLADAYASPTSQFVPIYGRRRVGKSELILKFLRGKPSLYFLGKQAPAQLQMREFLTGAARALQQPLLGSLQAADWKSVISAAVEQRPKGRKLVIVFDEFQWSAQASPELPSVIQDLWDLRWRRSRDILLILCGSFIGFMEREVLGKNSPLFGRRTAQIFLKPFSFCEAAEFHPAWSRRDRAQAYFICGGIPFYLRFFSASDSIRTNIERNLLSEFAALHGEPDFLLREELRELECYHGILAALAEGPRTAREAAAASGIAERGLHYYLEQLIQLGYLARRYPLTGRKPAARLVRFALDDPLLRFWFRFVYPNLSYISHTDPRRSFLEVIQPELESYFGSCFERLCREALPALYEAEGIGGPFEVGEYWDKNVQIDVVGRRKDGWIDIGECKWGQVSSATRLVEALRGKVPRYPNPENATVQPRLFLRERLRGLKAATGVRVHGLEDLYRA